MAARKHHLPGNSGAVITSKSEWQSLRWDGGVCFAFPWFNLSLVRSLANPAAGLWLSVCSTC